MLELILKMKVILKRNAPSKLFEETFEFEEILEVSFNI